MWNVSCSKSRGVVAIQFGNLHKRSRTPLLEETHFDDCSSRDTSSFLVHSSFQCGVLSGVPIGMQLLISSMFVNSEFSMAVDGKFSIQASLLGRGTSNVANFRSNLHSLGYVSDFLNPSLSPPPKWQGVRSRCCHYRIAHFLNDKSLRPFQVQLLQTTSPSSDEAPSYR